MMWNTSAVFENTFSRPVLNVFINITNLVLWKIFIFHCEIDVNSGPSFIELCDSKTNKNILLALAVQGHSVKYTLPYIFAKALNLWPWARSLKTFSHSSILHNNISDVRDHICQLITFKPIFGTSRNASVFSCDSEHVSHLFFANICRSFEETSCSGNLILIITINVK